MLSTIVLVASVVSAAPPPTTTTTSSVKTEARAVGELVTVSVARHKAFDVLSSADMRRVVELEADKATLGCTEAGSCLAELAGAMGARYVVFGQLAPIGAQKVLTLNLFDSTTGSSSGRVVALGAKIDDVITQIDAKVDELVAAADPGPSAAPKKLRVLVLDLETNEPAMAQAPFVDAGGGGDGGGGAGLWLLVGGGVSTLAGAGAAAAGGFFGVVANDAQSAALAAKFQDDRASAITRRDDNATTANVLYATGGVLAVGGAALMATSFLVGGGASGGAQ